MHSTLKSSDFDVVESELLRSEVSLAELEVAMLNPAAGTRHAAVMQPLQPRAQPGHCRENIKYLVKGENICI